MKSKNFIYKRIVREMLKATRKREEDDFNNSFFFPTLRKSFRKEDFNISFNIYILIFHSFELIDLSII